MPRRALTEDDVEQLMWPDSPGGTQQAHRDAAAEYEAWAAEPHPDDEVSVANLLVSAGEQLALADDVDGALALYERAVADGGESLPDARCYRIGALLTLGRDVEADAATAELMRTRPQDPLVYEYVGEQYEFSDRLDDANRWMTAGVTRLARDDAPVAFPLRMLMMGRRRVRQSLGFDEDEYDVIGRPSG